MDFQIIKKASAIAEAHTILNRDYIFETVPEPVIWVVTCGLPK